MVNVECPGCGSSYSVSEKRIPDGGLKMRCPKCSESFTVEKPSSAAHRGRTVIGVGAPAPLPEPAIPMSPGPPTDDIDDGFGSLDLDDIDAGFGSPTPDDVDAGFGSLDEAGGFGVIDLALPGGGGGEADLPMAHAGHDDLPMPAADLPMPAAPRPAPPRQSAPTERQKYADLPMPADADLPMAQQPRPRARNPLEADLPVPRAAAPRPPPEHADLPMPRAPRAARDDADLPMPRFSEDDLPMPAAGLPAVAHDNLPSVARDNLPSVAHDNLPSLAHDNLPSVAHDNLPLPADHNLPAVGADLPVPIDQDLPLPSPGNDLPLPADFNYPTRIGTSADSDIPLGEPLPMSHDDTDHDFLQDGRFPSEPPNATLPMIHDSLPPELRGNDLASLPPHLRGADLASLPPNRRGDMNVDEVLGLDGGAGGTDVLDEVDEGGDAPKVRIKKKRTRALRIALIAVPATLFVFGAVPFLLGYGVFGGQLIKDAIYASEHRATTDSFRDAARQQLAGDTAGEAKRALDQAVERQREMPRFAPMAAYASYLAFYNVTRFGADPAQLATGRQLIDVLKEQGSADPLVNLAMAANEAASGNYPQARSQLAGVLSAMPGDVDVLMLAGYVELRDHKADAAMAHFKKAAGVEKSARALYGMAQAALLLKKPDVALEQAREVTRVSKIHAGARTLVAQLVWEKDPKSAEPAKLLGEVTGKGPIRDAAGKDELVRAFSLYGTIQMEQKHLGAAETAFQEALKLEPQSQEALVGSGELFYQNGRFSEAKARFETAFRANSKNALAGVGMAKTMLSLEESKEALVKLTELDKQSKHPEVAYWLGRALELSGEKDSAEAAYRKAIANGADAPDSVVKSYVALASLLASMGKQADADKVLAEASEKLPESANLHFAKGTVALGSGRLQDAKSEFDKALELDDGDLRARFQLGITLRRMRDFPAAKIAFDEVAKADEEFPGLALERGVLFQETGDTDKALAAYNEALKKAPDDIDLKLRVGATQVISGHGEEAVKLLREVLDKRQNSAEVKYFLGRALLLRGNAAEALRYLQMAVQADSNRADYHLYTAWAANEANNTSVAEEEANKALELDKNLGDAYWQRAVVMQKRGKSLDALKELAVALEKNPSRAEAYATMAKCYHDQSNNQKEEEAFRKAIELKDDVADWHYFLGKLLYDGARQDEAIEHLEKAIKLVKNSAQRAGWLAYANFLVGEGLRTRDPKRALEAYRAYIKSSKQNDAYREDARLAIEELEKQVGE